MADATAANVIVDRVWTEGAITGKDRIGMLVRITGITAGSAANKILATAFGLRVIESCSGIWPLNDNLIAYGARPSYDGTMIHLSNLEAATDADRMLAADVAIGSGYLKGEIHGYA